MQAAGVGFVTLGVFSWALLEPRPGEFDFGWFDEVVELLADGGIAIDMATATAAPPPWLTAAHPEILPVDHAGHILWPGSRQSWCPSSPVFREHALALVEQMARRYGRHPAVRLWHVSNELGCHNGRCWCDVSAAAFRRWLADRYGDIDKLNDAWGTAFWSQRYTDVRRGAAAADHACGAQPHPAVGLRALLLRRVARLLPRRTRRPPAALDRARHDQLHDHARTAPNRTTSRGRPKWTSSARTTTSTTAWPHPHAEQAFADDLTRGVAGGSWLLMESATSAVNWQPVNIAKQPGELLVDSLRHVARGADGVGFFQWRASRAGGEKFHSALVPHAGPDSARFREVAALGAALKAIGEVAGTPVTADVALLWDWNARWACDLDSHPSAVLRYVDAPHRWHRALTELGATVDVVHPAADLSAYRLVVVPTLYLCSDGLAPALEGVAARGGHVLVTYFSGIVDEQDHVRLGGYPGAFRSLLGVRSEEFAPLRTPVTLDDGVASPTFGRRC